MSTHVIDLAYLLAAVLFIVALKCLSSVRTAAMGNALGAVGMLVAIVATLLMKEVVDFPAVLLGLIVGTLVGTVLAFKVQMTGMPQMVALLNGFGGAASALVGAAEIVRYVLAGRAEPGPLISVPVAASILIGAVTFTGSILAFAKLQELMTGKPILFPLQKVLNALLGAACIALSVWLVMSPYAMWPMYGLALLSCILGITLVLPIGGADMPVVISLLNSYSGIAGAAAGFVLNNSALIISGSLVGASGIILTQIMCKAMNRSLLNVMFAGVGAEVKGGGGPAAQDGRTVRGYGIDDIAIVFDGIQRVIIVPGYGMAVSQAQHAVKQLSDILQSKGIDVKYAIHPVAGRMPGHMNVLLAEANVPYDQLYEMDQINAEFTETDVALVVGANDITNPSARTRKDSPLYGMPILDVDKARTVIVCKRSMNPGFAGIDNELYLNPKTMMLFGDAKKSIGELASALKG